MVGENLLGQMGDAYTALKLRLTWPFILWSAAVAIPTWVTYKLLIKPFLSPLRAVSLSLLAYFNEYLTS